MGGDHRRAVVVGGRRGGEAEHVQAEAHRRRSVRSLVLGKVGLGRGPAL